ncbi:diacylglycerol lipase-beta-like isoform X2 [Mya arenaria]|uniref:diacylglycerol lipase-beta-like isoform X2 n=1 Tax=Mya arenaria TaxID=6604 RepID=UPI0022E646E3|nr:diacylglycerol lipase-beta-like isoform X2 [Mya arenaria]
MPQLVLFKRSWGIGSDDFVFPGAIDGTIRILWTVMVVAFYAMYGQDLDATCPDSLVLHVYFVGLVFFLVVTAVLEYFILAVSMRGTIADSSARTPLPILLYIRLSIALPEVIWNAYGTWTAFDAAEHCHRNVVRLAKGTVIAGWVVFVIAMIVCLVVCNLYTGKNKKRAHTQVRSFKRASRRSVRTTKQWEKRCKCMFMCARGDGEDTSVFATLAELSADYFKGVDLVPSDVIAGLILLSRKQERKRQQWRVYVNETENKRPMEDTVDSPGILLEETRAPPPWMTLDLMSHYLRFAIGSYGWPFYLTLTNRLCGLCGLCSACRCCACIRPDERVNMDNCCLCNTAAFLKTSGVHTEDIVYASLKNGIYEIPFYVVIDRESNAVVIAIRGTLSLQDVVTDLVIERDDLNIPSVTGSGHKGILQSALYIQKTLQDGGIIQEAFNRAKCEDLVITGHSLGAGVAAMLTILLKTNYPKVRCYAFSPPGELVSPEVCEWAEDVVCSVVLGDDIICRQGMLMMDDLKIQIITAINETRMPKYQILSSGCWRMCCGRSGMMEDDVTHSNGDVTDGSNGVVQDIRCSLKMSLEECEAHSKTIQNSYEPLHLPGRILHIEESVLSGDDEFSAMWKSREEFTEIIVSPDMLANHFPDALLDAIDQLRERNCVPTAAPEPLFVDTRMEVEC